MANASETKLLTMELLRNVPELGSIYDEHMRDYEELLPHVFFGDVTRYVVEQVRSGATGSRSSVARIVHALEEGLVKGNEDVLELISVSFLENLAAYDDVFIALKQIAGSHLVKAMNAYGS